MQTRSSDENSVCPSVRLSGKILTSDRWDIVFTQTSSLWWRSYVQPVNRMPSVDNRRLIHRNEEIAMRRTHAENKPDEVRVSIVTDNDLIVLVVFRVRSHTQLTNGWLGPLRQRSPGTVAKTTTIGAHDQCTGGNKTESIYVNGNFYFLVCFTMLFDPTFIMILTMSVC